MDARSTTSREVSSFSRARTIFITDSSKLRVNAISEMLDPNSVPDIDMTRLRSLCAHGMICPSLISTLINIRILVRPPRISSLAKTSCMEVGSISHLLTQQLLNSVAGYYLAPCHPRRPTGQKKPVNNVITIMCVLFPHSLKKSSC